jgi:hypothetical protein
VKGMGELEENGKRNKKEKLHKEVQSEKIPFSLRKSRNTIKTCKLYRTFGSIGH